MDYSFTQALRTCKHCKRVCHYYDINCSFWEYFFQRCANSEFLEVPENMEFFKGIGLFHVHGHQDQCFPRFAPSFIEGAGQLEGEIIETLWPQLNSISPSTRNMSKSGRQETLDIHMQDSNWKKLVNMGTYIRPFPLRVLLTSRVTQFHPFCVTGAMYIWALQIARMPIIRFVGPSLMIKKPNGSR